MLFGKSDVAKLWEAVRGLTEASEKLEREMKGLRLDWESAYDKLQRLAQRISKRAEVVEKAEAAARPGVNGDGATPLEPLHSGHALTDHQRQVQQAILRRRAGQ